MSAEKLTQAEAQQLLDMLKRSLIEEISFPSRGRTEEFDVVGDSKTDIFAINIYRGRIQPFKYNIGARIKKNGIMLLELHINPTNVHQNPVDEKIAGSGEKVTGSHWHIYTEGYGREFAFPAEDIESDQFVNNTIKFLEKFNVIEQPNILFQLEVL